MNPIKKPWLIQRCTLTEGKLLYDYMGSNEFEGNSQAKSLKRIFAAGITFSSVKINLDGREIIVYVVTGKGFDFTNYQPYLQQLAENKLQLQEPTYFDNVAKVTAGIPTRETYKDRTTAWFDFENDVLWTLSKKDRRTLVKALEGIQRRWSEKEKDNANTEHKRAIG